MKNSNSSNQGFNCVVDTHIKTCVVDTHWVDYLAHNDSSQGHTYPTQPIADLGELFILSMVWLRGTILL